MYSELKNYKVGGQVEEDLIKVESITVDVRSINPILEQQKLRRGKKVKDLDHTSFSTTCHRLF